MARNRTIIDCYTDEPAGLGVPPFLGVWPRYLAGKYRDLPNYLTIDDLRMANFRRKPKRKKLYPRTGKTRKDLINHTREYEEILEIINNSDQLLFVAGVQTPGKYLSAEPGSIGEILKLTKKFPKINRILTGPAASAGSQRLGGRSAEIARDKDFNSIRPIRFKTYDQLQKYAMKGARIFQDLPHNRRVVEIETGRGCLRKNGCSFCTEPLKHDPEWRSPQDIIDEVEKFMDYGASAFRLGKQSCLYSYQGGDGDKLEKLVKGIAELEPQVFHFDNANPAMINEQKTELLVKYLTPGSTAAIGVESFDDQVIQKNNLNSDFATTYRAIELLNEIGGERGANGNPKLLPGINIILGLEGETKQTLERNFKALKRIMDDGLLFRRVNIRRVVPFPGTPLAERVGDKFLRRNKKYYKRWIKKVRKQIDFPMLKKIYPEGTILKNMYTEVNHGNKTFLRQLGSYPIVAGVDQRLPLGEKYSVKITGHNPRSLKGEILD
ncbi:MAG TPA: radical SAM protein [bacterium]|nr:radical SAM protein [bacterium]